MGYIPNTIPCDVFSLLARCMPRMKLRADFVSLRASYEARGAKTENN